MSTVVDLDAIILKIENEFATFLADAKDRRKSDGSIVQTSQMSARVKSCDFAKLLKEFRTVSKETKLEKIAKSKASK